MKSCDAPGFGRYYSKKPSQSQINKAVSQNKKAFRIAGVDFNKSTPFTKSELARTEAALRMLCKKERSK
tara:strand:+ start:856 stop:1062 length:207 start_codon:yes stop_codon:yes gene_type:complete